MEPINQYDLNWAVRRLQKPVRDILKKYPIMVGGGYIRSIVTNSPVNDVDLFVADKDLAKTWAMELVDGNEKKLIETDNAITIPAMRPTVQFITRWLYERPEDVLSSFDFTICQAVFWHERDLADPDDDLDDDGDDKHPGRWRSMVTPAFYPDLAARRLVYTVPIREEEPGGSMLRVLKYYQGGFRMPLSSLANVITRLVGGVEFDGDRNVLDRDGSRINPEQFAKIIKGLLVEVDPNVDPDHIIED